MIPGLGLSASAQQATGNPLPPPQAVPQSRLTITPSEFERWLARRPAPAVVAPGRKTQTPAIAPPRVPTLTAPPPPVMAPPPPAVLSTAPGAPRLADRPQRAEPDKPREPVIVPPDSPARTVPQEPAVANVPRPGDIRIVYAPDATEVTAAARGDLTDLAVWLAANPSVRIEIRAFASQKTASGSQARRLSLLRAREVRRYLVDHGVAETQIDVRALGADTDETPKDRVEINLPSP